jgi:DnaK suppressor protein
MSAKQKTDNHRKIEQKLTELEGRLLHELEQRLVNVGNTSSHKPTELFDLAADGELDYMSAVSAEAGSDTVREIQQALIKLREGTYGICEDCGKRITKRRLKARPFAILCINCKQEQERRRYAEGTQSYARGGSLGAVDLGEQEGADMDGQFRDALRELEDLELNEMY